MMLTLQIGLSAQEQTALTQHIMQSSAARVPGLDRLPQSKFSLIMRDSLGRIIAGTSSELRWGWLYPDTVWVDESRRGQGDGLRIMLATEAVAAAQGVRNAWLMTTSFQARPFYEKLGYQIFGHNANRPQGHDMYYLFKRGLQSQPPDPHITLQQPPDAADLAAIERGLLAHAAPHAPLNPDQIALSLRDEAGRLCGGLFGYCWWDHFDMHAIWVQESLRFQGYGRRLIERAMEICHEKRVHAIIAEVADFQDQAFFQRLGFHSFGQLQDRPPGHITHFMRGVLRKDKQDEDSQ